MARTAAFVPGTAAACVVAGAAQVWAKKVDTPSPVDAADPVPASPPKADDPLFPEIVGAPAAGAAPALPPYEGIEYKLGPFHVRPAEMKMEGVMLSLIAGYLLTTFIIRKSNASCASTWLKANEAAFREEFAGVGLGKGQLFAMDGGDEAVSYATGRRAVEHVWTKVRTNGQDLLARLYHIVRGIIDYQYDSGSDKVTVDFKLAEPKGTPGAKLCFAVVKRDVLRKTRDARWDLRTFTAVTEATGVAPSLIAMTESGDVTNALLKDQETGLLDALQEGAEGLEWLESLVVSDMPAQTPDEEKPKLPENEYHLTLTFRLPPSSRSAETAPWISLACNIADILYSKQKLVPETAINKLKKRRADALETLLKPLREEEAERVEEAKQDAIALKRKMEADKRESLLRKMTPAERMKFQKKEEEKERKKMMKAQVKRQR